MNLQAFDKYEYKYSSLYSSLDKSIDILNKLGQEGWEVIELFKPHSVGEQYKVLLKRKITEVEI